MQELPEDLKKLDERIKSFKKKDVGRNSIADESDFSRFSRIGFRVGTEMLSGVLAGGAIGYFLDDCFQTKPLWLVVFLFLGGAAGVLNVYRFAKSEEKQREE